MMDIRDYAKQLQEKARKINLKRLRTHLNLSQRQVAEGAGVSASAISLLERGIGSDETRDKIIYFLSQYLRNPNGRHEKELLRRKIDLYQSIMDDMNTLSYGGRNDD